MWTKEQIINCDKVLTGIKNSDFNNEETVYYKKLVKEIGFYRLEETVKLLIIEKLVFSIDDKNYHVQLSDLGNFANIIGFKSYIRLKYIVTFLLVTLPIAISIFALFYSRQAVSISRENQSYDRDNKTNNIRNSEYNDSVFIKKIKNFIKHDSVFLNELKENIKHEKKITTP